MKTFKFILLALVVSNTITAQKNVRPTKNLDSYEGTWIYQKNDIIFKIKLQKGQEAWRNDLINGLYGGYYLSVRGEVLENYMSGFPVYWDFSKDPRPNNMYIWVSIIKDFFKKEASRQLSRLSWEKNTSTLKFIDSHFLT